MSGVFGVLDRGGVQLFLRLALGTFILLAFLTFLFGFSVSVSLSVSVVSMCFALRFNGCFLIFFLRLVPDVVDEAVLDKDESSSDDGL